MGKVVGNANIQPEEFFFEGLGRQNMSFEQAVAELIDNSIGAAGAATCEVEVRIDALAEGKVRVSVADRSSGIPLHDLLNRALKPGAQPISSHRLNEHGFGLKNALCSLTKNELAFEILTRDADAVKAGKCYKVQSPSSLISPKCVHGVVGGKRREANSQSWPLLL